MLLALFALPRLDFRGGRLRVAAARRDRAGPRHRTFGGGGPRRRRRRAFEDPVDAIQLLTQIPVARGGSRVGGRLAWQVVAELVLIDARLLLVERRGAVGCGVAVGREAGGLASGRGGEQQEGEDDPAQRRSVLGVWASRNGSTAMLNSRGTTWVKQWPPRGKSFSSAPLMRRASSSE